MQSNPCNPTGLPGSIHPEQKPKPSSDQPGTFRAGQHTLHTAQQTVNVTVKHHTKCNATALHPATNKQAAYCCAQLTREGSQKCPPTTSLVPHPLLTPVSTPL